MNCLGKITVLLLLVCLILPFSVITTQPCEAQYGQVVINANGTIEPATAPIQRIGETYILTGDVGSITIKKSNIVLDGMGYKMPGKVSFVDSLGNNVTANNAGGIFLNKVDKVTVKNLLIKDSQTGVYLEQSTNCVITNNTIVGTHAIVPGLQVTAAVFVWGGNNSIITENKLEDNYSGLYLGYDSQNTILKNNITGSTYTAIALWNSSNRLYCNNFVDNEVQVSVIDHCINIWDNGEKGNFWSDYNGLGIYVINENNIDHYPLSQSVDIHSVAPSQTVDPEQNPVQTQTIIVIAVVAVMVIAIATLSIYRRHQKTASLNK